MAGDLTAGPSGGYGLGAAAVAAVFPCHVVWDRELRTVQTGPVVRRLVPALAGGGTLQDCFTLRRPRGDPSFALLTTSQGHSHRVGLLEARDDPRLVLRGQFLLLEDREHVMFVGSPVAVSLEALVGLGLTLSDFPVHDGVADFLLMVRSQAVSLAEAKELAAELRRLNAELEHRVAERTGRLAASNAALEARTAELESRTAELLDLSERLRQEIQERQRVEADLRLAHKLEAVGQLAAGIAHEINTPVQFVGDNLRFLGEAVDGLQRLLGAYEVLADAVRAGTAGPADLARLDAATAASDPAFLLAEAPVAVAESLDGTHRMSQIVRAMKEFAHPDHGSFAPADLNESVRTTLVVCRNEYRDVADVVTDLDPGLPAVLCRRGEINQVVLDLVVNAAHAVAARVGRSGERGSITVTTRRAGEDVELTVADTGTGIAPEIAARVFDPFFTTKDVGHGTGQGLSTAHAIVTQRHGGRISFTSDPGAGTVFTVRLPVPRPPSG